MHDRTDYNTLGRRGRFRGDSPSLRLFSMNTLPLRGDHITLAQAIKAAHLVESGGQAKLLIRTGEVKVNGTVVVQPAKKLHAGDTFELAGQPSCQIVAPAE